jgi:4-carboxymuconolactone decarboxylase
MSIQPGSVQRINTPTRRDVLKATMGVMIAAPWGGSPAYAEEERMTTTTKSNALPSVLTYDDVRTVSPALEHYTKGALLDGLWQRPELSPRDRSIVTVAALIARTQTIEMLYYFALAMNNGVKPSQLSEIITHLAGTP